MSKQVEEIKQWIIKGDHDLGTAQITYLYIPVMCITIYFLNYKAMQLRLDIRMTPFIFQKKKLKKPCKSRGK